MSTHHLQVYIHATQHPIAMLEFNPSSAMHVADVVFKLARILQCRHILLCMSTLLLLLRVSEMPDGLRCVLCRREQICDEFGHAVGQEAVLCDDLAMDGVKLHSLLD